VNQNLAVAGTSPDALAPVVTLSDHTRDLLARAMPEGTRRAYTGDLRRFLDWCAARDLIATPTAGADALGPAFTALLATGVDLPTLATDYVGHLAAAGKAAPTIERALAAISRTYKAATGVRMATDGPRAALRTYRRDRAATPCAEPRKAAPVTIDVLRAMVATTNSATVAGLRDRALLVLGFALGARRSELAALDGADVRETAEGIQVLIRRSKTDRDSAGRTVAVPYGTHPDTCPVRVTRTWVALLAAHGRRSGPLFVRVDRHGTLGRAPSGRGSVDGRLTGQAVALIVKRAAEAAGLDPVAAWSGHSLRRGFATEAYRNGADRLRIARHGGWDDNSRALAGYVEEVDRWKSNPLTGIGL
jgi:site-specific recombinase XerD